MQLGIIGKNNRQLYEIYLKIFEENAKNIKKDKEIAPYMSDYMYVVNLIKSELQLKYANLWKKNKYKLCIELPTGLGKTRLGLYAFDVAKIKQNKGEKIKILIIVPRIAIKTDWAKEIVKWKYDSYNCNYEIITHAKFVKDNKNKNNYNEALFEDNTKKILIIDEGHKMTTPLSKTAILNYAPNAIIALSATLNKEQKERYKQMDVNTEGVSINEAIKLGIVARHTRINYLVPFDNNNLKKYYEDKTNSLNSFKEKFGNDVFEIFNDIIRSKAGYQITTTEGEIISEERAQKLAYAYMDIVRKRKEAVQMHNSKLVTLLKIIDNLIGASKAIVFMPNIESVNTLEYIRKNVIAYHSDLKPKEREKIIETFNSQKLVKKNIIACVGALDEGVNFNNIKYGISLDHSSSIRKITQREGRILRPDYEKLAIFINIVTENTVEEKWVQRSYYKHLQKPKEFNTFESLHHYINECHEYVFGV